MTTTTSMSSLDRSERASPAIPRPRVRAVALAAILLVPVVASILLGTSGVNLTAGVLLIAVAIGLGFRLDRRWLQAPASHAAGGVLVFFGVFAVAWQWQIGDLWLNSQILLYAGIALAFPACLTWFRETGQGGARQVFELKLGAVIGSSLLMLAAVWSLPRDPGALREIIFDPPVYGHLRHFNNDQLPGLALGIYFASLAERRGARTAWFVVLTAMGFLAAWSGGRGIMLSLAVFLVLVLTFRVLPLRSVALACGALALGALLVLLTGHADLLLRLFFRWSGSVNEISSNRIEIWLSSLAVWRESWLSILFGFGPDAMRTTVRALIDFPMIHQPHNGFVQVLIEFGIVGLCLFVAAVGVIARRAIAILRWRNASSEARVAAAMLVALGVYMLNDGIIYHAIPLIMVMLLIAYLFSFDLADPTRAAESNRA